MIEMNKCECRLGWKCSCSFISITIFNRKLAYHPASVKHKFRFYNNMSITLEAKEDDSNVYNILSEPTEYKINVVFNEEIPEMKLQMTNLDKVLKVCKEARETSKNFFYMGDIVLFLSDSGNWILKYNDNICCPKTLNLDEILCVLQAIEDINRANNN